ncbi:MFS transporter [Roseomonas sp. HJA6]|uniref:MFS transporter n=1 Tax=Roseomonas alba TaxID=2846776 RepID=A0ABS7A855_9PROT|nr:MFS transporter [Neoroseomonas alba]MBW6398471.1 MFS transporter [Neoroseomonas alba]
MNRKAFAWASFDWANSAFPTVVSTFVIAAYFTQGIAPDPATGQAQWGWMQTLSALGIAVLSPLLGAIADRGGHRRMLLALCTLVTAVFTGLVWYAQPNPSWTLWLLVCVGIATLAFELGTVFYNSMLPEVAEPAQMGRISGLAWGLGYAGGLACLAIALVLLVQPNPPLFGLDRSTSEQVRATALLVAVWTVVFGWPVLVMVPDQPGEHLPMGQAVTHCVAETRGLLRGLPRRPDMMRFLIARLFYTDGLNTLFAFGAIFAAGVHGMTFEEILLFGIALNVTAGLGAAGFGLVEDRLGSKPTVMVALVAMVVVGAALLLTDSKAVFWGLAMVLGIFMGPAQAASRTLMARMAPEGEVTAHFGLFALSGRVTGFFGPAVLAAVTDASGSQRAGMATVLVFLAVGAAILATVRPVQG